MQESIRKRIIKHSVWLSILLHLLFVLAFSVAIILQPQPEKKPPHDFVPSYVYKGAITPKQNPITRDTKPIKQAEQKKPIEKELPRSKYGLQKQSILATSLATLKQNQLQALRRPPSDEEPMLLIGDQNEMADPLIKLIGRSLSANFRYPETEGRLGINGRVILELTLHPDGRFTDIRMVKSSENHNLDSAALFAANNAPVILGADRFLEKPKRFVIGFVFYT